MFLLSAELFRKSCYKSSIVLLTMTRLQREHFLFSEGKPLNAETTPKKCCWMDVTHENLKKLNIAAFAFHLVFAIISLSVGIAKKNPFNLVVTRSLPVAPTPVPVPFNNATCGGTEYDNVYKWFDCISEKNDYKVDLVKQNGYTVVTGNAQAPDAVMPPFNTTFLLPYEDDNGELTGFWPLWTLITAFCVLTALFHALLAWPLNKEYRSWLDRYRQPLRYVEYSITASIMFVIVLALSRVTDIYLLIANALLMMCVNTFGGIIEWIEPFDYKMYDSKAGVSFYPQLAVRLWGWIVSFLVFVFQFWQLWNIFEYTVQPWLVDTNPTAELFGQLFNFVRVLNWAILLSFCVFPIINAVQVAYYVKYSSEPEKLKEYSIQFETSYVMASFLSKGLLVIIVFAGAVMRD